MFFDFDGTLVDSEPLHYDCWMQAVRLQGGYVDWDDYVRRFVGVSDFDVGGILLREAGLSPTESDAREACTRKKTLYQARFVNELEVGHDICDWLIAAFRDGLTLGVVSSSLVPEVEPLLFRHNIRAVFDLLVCGDHVAKRKPDPEPYRLALDLANVARSQRTPGTAGLRPEDCLVVEDSDSGAHAARAAGMKLRRVESPGQLLGVLERELSTVAGSTQRGRPLSPTA